MIEICGLEEALLLGDIAMFLAAITTAMSQNHILIRMVPALLQRNDVVNGGAIGLWGFGVNLCMAELTDPAIPLKHDAAYNPFDFRGVGFSCCIARPDSRTHLRMSYFVPFHTGFCAGRIAGIGTAACSTIAFLALIAIMRSIVLIAMCFSVVLNSMSM